MAPNIPCETLREYVGKKEQTDLALCFFVLITVALLQPSLVWAVPNIAPPQKVEVVIIGAGLSGLSTAAYLKEADISFHILELKPRIGGRTRTVAYHRLGEQVVVADAGMEEYWSSNPAIKFLKVFNLPLEIGGASSSLMLQGKLQALLGDEPQKNYLQRVLRGADFTAYKQFQELVRPMVKILQSRHRPLPEKLLQLKDISFFDWLYAQQFSERVRELIRVSIEPEIATSIAAISALDGIAEFHIFLGADGEGEQAIRVLGGNQLFVEALADLVGRKHISVNQRVTAVRSFPQLVRVSYHDQETFSMQSIEARHVVSTIPLYRLFEVQFEPGLSEQKIQAIRTMSWGSYFKAHVFTKPSASRLWTEENESILPILSDSKLGVIYEGDLNANGMVRILSLLVHGSYAEVFNLMQPQIVREEILSSLEQLWPSFREHYLDMEFYRLHPRAIASWPVGRSRYDGLSDAIRMPEHRVYLAGDHTESTHSDGAFLSAERVVRQIIAAREANVDHALFHRKERVHGYP